MSLQERNVLVEVIINSQCARKVHDQACQRQSNDTPKVNKDIVQDHLGQEKD